MRYAALLLLLVGCEDTPNEPIDAPLMIDASVDAAIDARASCAKRSDCNGRDCLLCCGMLLTCYSECGSFDTVPSGSPCKNVACDPTVPTCERGNATGTCTAYQPYPPAGPTYYMCK